MGTSYRVIIGLGLCALLQACASLSNTESNKALSAGEVSVKGGVVKEGMTYFQCPSTTCRVPVKVTVQTGDASGKTCTFELPDVVVVKLPETTIEWVLSGPMGTEDFDSDGIKIKTHSSDSAAFERPVQGSKSVKILSHNPRFRLFGYDIKVKHGFGGKKCDPFDPIIVNSG